MKDKIFKILVLFFVVFLGIMFVLISKKPTEIEVVDIPDVNEFILEDGNKVKLFGISIFSPDKNYKSKIDSKELGISEDTYLFIGKSAHAWLIENVKNKKVLIYNYNPKIKNEVQKVEIILNDEDLAQILLKYGLAYVTSDSKNKKYFRLSNINQIKSNARIFVESFYKQVPKIKIEKEELLIPNSIGVYKDSVYKKFDEFELYLINPLVYDKPNNLCNDDFCKRLVQEINSANDTIDIAIYGFGERRDILNALIDARKRGVYIRAVTDTDERFYNPYVLTKEFVQEFNARHDNMSSLMHNKFFIFDKKIVFSGSVNISLAGVGGYNSNVAIFTTNEQIVQRYINEFEQLYERVVLMPKAKQENICDDACVYFSPKDDVYNSVLSPLIKNAKKSIYISAFYLTYENLFKELAQAKERGLEVLVLLDSIGARNYNQKIKYLRKKGIPVAVENWGGKNHEKTMVIDDEILILGSCNFSNSGFYRNDENTLVLKKPEMAKFYSDYYLYLFNSIPKKFLKVFPRAEGFDSVNSCFDGIDNNFDGKIDSEDDGCKK